MLVQGGSLEDQIGYVSSFEGLKNSGRLTEFKAIPWVGINGSQRWHEFWQDVSARCRDEEFDCLFLQYFHKTGIPNPAPYLEKIRKANPNLLVVTSSGDPFDPLWNPPPASLYQAASQSDLVLTTSMGRLAGELFKRGAKRVSLFPHSACPVRFMGQVPQRPPTHDVVFIGSRTKSRNPAKSHFWVDRLRARAVARLQKTFGSRFGLHGHGWEGMPSWQGPAEFSRQVEVAASGSVVFGGFPGSRNPFYSSNREPIQMLSGRPLVDFEVAGLRNIYGGEDHFAGFTDMQGAIGSIKHLLEDESFRSEMGNRARENVLARHMNTHRVETFCDFVEEVIDAKKEHREGKQPRASFLIPGSLLPHPTSLGW